MNVLMNHFILKGRLEVKIVRSATHGFLIMFIQANYIYVCEAMNTALTEAIDPFTLKNTEGNRKKMLFFCQCLLVQFKEWLPLYFHPPYPFSNFIFIENDFRQWLVCNIWVKKNNNFLPSLKTLGCQGGCGDMDWHH